MIVDPDTPQPKPLTGIPVPGIKTSDQIVSEIHGAMANLPPEHQAALDHGISVLKGPPSGASEAPPIPPGATPTATRGYYVENGVPYQSSPDSTAQHGASAAMDEPTDASIRFDGQPGFTPVTAPDSQGAPADLTAPVTARPSDNGAANPQSAALPGMANVTPNDIAANQPEIALPTKRSLSGRMSLLESPSMIGPKVGAYQPIPSPSSPAATELKRLRDTGSGVSQIHNPFLKTLGTVADVIGSGMFPQFAQFVPGSSAHHEQLISGKEAQVGDEQKQRKLDEEAQKAADESVTADANAHHLNAEADAAANKPPPTITTDKGIMQWNPTTHAYDVMAGTSAPKEEVEGKTVTTAKGIMQWNPKTHAYDIKVGDAEPKDQQNVHVLPDGSVVAVHHDPKTGKSTAEVVYKGDPKVEAEVAKLEVDGESHTVLLDKKTGKTIKDLGKTGEKPASVNINQGTWSIQEDEHGKPIEYNSKTGEVRPVAAGGVQKAGTQAKRDAEEEKKAGPGRDALKYADDYLTTGAFTGPGDVALQEKFFELAKPSSGFRMTKEQMKKLQDSSSWLGSLEGKAYHALHGTWFSPDQRKDIVTAMKALQKTHEPAAGGGSGKVEEWSRDASGKLVKK